MPKNNAHTLWRDQVVEPHESITVPTIDVPAFEQKNTQPQVFEIPKVVEEPPIVVAEVSQPEILVEKPKVTERETIAPFELQAYCLEKCVIFVDVTALETEEKTTLGKYTKGEGGTIF